jgi:protein TonB
MVYGDFFDDSDDHKRLKFAILLASILHLSAVLGLSFDSGKQQDYTPQLEVTLATRATLEVPDKAKLLAANDQLGSGDLSDHNDITSREVAPTAQTQIDQNASRAIPDQEQQQYASPATATSAAAQTYITKRPQAEMQLLDPTEGTNPEINRLSRQLASLEARLDAQSQAYSTMPRVRRLTSASAKRAVDAAYLLRWRQRVEAVGNKYYPEASERYSIYGSLRLLVVIRRDGSLEQIELLSSSGHSLLDEAAIKIVRMAAPFAPFSAELRASTDKLEIIRTWQFQQNRLSSG